MTVRLVKRGQIASERQKKSTPPSPNQLAINAQGWVEEFRTRKAKTNQQLSSMLKRA